RKAPAQKIRRGREESGPIRSLPRLCPGSLGREIEQLELTETIHPELVERQRFGQVPGVEPGSHLPEQLNEKRLRVAPCESFSLSNPFSERKPRGLFVGAPGSLRNGSAAKLSQ